MQAAHRLFKDAISKHACSIKVTLDKSAANKKAIDSFNFDLQLLNLLRSDKINI